MLMNDNLIIWIVNSSNDLKELSQNYIRCVLKVPFARQEVTRSGKTSLNTYVVRQKKKKIGFSYYRQIIQLR